MKFYLAPLEGITGYIYRNAYHEMFPDFDKYFTPFIAVKQDKTLSSKEIKDIRPENNHGMQVVPQILCNRGTDFIKTAKKIKNYGYTEVNLNLGCPSGTVVPKKKGAGLLREPVLLKSLLDEIYESVEMDISLKTRLGMQDPEEFEEILECYNQYPVSELIIHARVREDYYLGKPNWNAFGKALENCRCPVVYNGDIFQKEDFEKLKAAFPKIETVMIGRGQIANPALLRQIQGGEALNVKELRKFSECLTSKYREVSSGEKDVLFKMKELWNFFSWNFAESEKCLKMIRKCQKISDYEEAVRKICRDYAFR